MIAPLSQLFDISGRVAVVTGASSGIGLAISETLAQAGAHVVLLARRSDLLKTNCQAIADRGGKTSWAEVDLLDREQLQSCFEPVCAPFGAPDIIVNCAGVNLRQSTDQVDWDGWDTTVNLNLTAPFFFSRLFVDSMKRSGWGRIINIASLQSVRAFKNSVAYGASKGGVAQLTRAMAESWSRYGIGCNAISPGFFHTPLTESVFANDELSNKMALNTAIGRNGRLEDLNGPVLFLASPASDYVTGQLLFVDGGFTAK